uniref:Chaperonin-containing T-complex member BBS12 n=1 Tax=Pogona vitticeps TaxID=103695 RepID=A0ABM5GJE4_9SAUR
MALRSMNTKRHTGLQQLSALAYTGRTLLGPAKSSKFIVDESTPGSVFVCSAVRLLENLDLDSAVGQLLNETIQAQNKEYKTGTTTLLFLVSAWSKAVLECLQQDVPLSVIVTVMSETLNSCIEHVEGFALSLHSIKQGTNDTPIEWNEKALFDISCGTSEGQGIEMKTSDIKLNRTALNLVEYPYECSKKSEERLACSTLQQANECSLWGSCVYSEVCATGSTVCSLNSINCTFAADKTMIQKNYSLQNCHLGVSDHKKRSKVTHSRYFSAVNESLSLKQTHQVGQFDGLSDLGQLAMSLSHGNSSAMKLVQDILRYQLQTGNKMAATAPFQFNILEIVTCCLPGMSESHSCIYPGYITLVPPETAAVVKHFQDKPFRVILVDGDLTEIYRHLGLNRPQNTRIFSGSASALRSSSSSWVDSVLDILIQSDINLVLVQGTVCKNLEERCLLNNIVIICQVAPNVLRAFSNTTRADKVTYLTQMNEHCIGKGICMKLCGIMEINWVEFGDQVPVALTAEGMTLVTAVLGCPITSKMQATEDCFWTCAYRVHYALHDQAVFPGGGTVEFLCLTYLENLAKEAENFFGELPCGSSWLAKSSEQYKPLVLNSLASGWHEYLCTLMCNTANCVSKFEASAFIQQHLRRAAESTSPSTYILDAFKNGALGAVSVGSVGSGSKALQVYDNVAAKREAWHRALDLVLLMLQTDAEIITGPKKDQLLKSEASSEFLFL